MRIHVCARNTHTHTNTHISQDNTNKYNPILDMSTIFSKFSKIWDRKILKEFLLGLLTKKINKKMMCVYDKWGHFFFTREFSAWEWHQCVGMSGIWWSLRFVVETLLVNDMPLSSSPSLGSPPILQAREITREQTAPNFTQRGGEESAQRTIPAITLRNFPFFLAFYLLRLFPRQSSDACSNLFKYAHWSSRGTAALV